MCHDAILGLMGIKRMLNTANLNFLASWRYGANPEPLAGVIFVIFSIAAAEAVVGLALVTAIYRHYQTTDLGKIVSLKG